jgi:hypothetical protein
MNEKMLAAQDDREHTEASDFVELGEVTSATKGLLVGAFYDGGFWWWG